MERRKLLIGGGAALGLAAVGALAYRKSTSLTAYDDAARELRARLAEDPGAASLVRAASLAANGHNTQPWRFRIARDLIEILPDFARRTPVVDPDDHHLFASLGGAAENLAIAAASQGRPADVVFDASKGRLLVRFGAGSDTFAPLAAAITRRQSTRAAYDGRKAPPDALRLLAAAARVDGVHTTLITAGAQMAQLKALVIEGNSAQIADPAFVAELRDWLRFSPAKALATRDGLFSGASGNPVIPDWLGRRMFTQVFDADTENGKYARAIDSSAGAAIFVAERDDPAHWAAAGRASQRFALQATALGMTCAYLNQPVEVARLRGPLAALAGAPGLRPDIVLRFGFGPRLPYSLRRPVGDVIA